MSPELNTPIDAYLDAVDKILLNSGISRVRRVAIMRDLELHVNDALREKCAGREPTPADVAAILADLDPPESFGAASTMFVRAPRRKLPSSIRWSAVLLFTGLIGMLILLNAYDSPHRDVSDFLIFMIASAPVTLMIVTGSVLGFTGYRKIQHQPDRYWGQIIAVIEMAATPILLLVASPVLFLALAFTCVLLGILNHLYDIRTAGVRFLTSV